MLCSLRLGGHRAGPRHRHGPHWRGRHRGQLRVHAEGPAALSGHHQPSLCILISEAVRPADDDVVSSTWRKCLHLAERMAEIPANSRQKGGL